MARIVVQTEDHRAITFDEHQVRPDLLADEHSADDLLERLRQGVKDAEVLGRDK